MTKDSSKQLLPPSPLPASDNSSSLQGLSWQQGLGTVGSQPYVPPTLPYKVQDVDGRQPQAEYVDAPLNTPSEIVSTPLVAQPGQLNASVEQNPPAAQNWELAETQSQIPQMAPVPPQFPEQAQVFAPINAEQPQPQQSVPSRKKLYIIIAGAVLLLVLGASIADLSSRNEPAMSTQSNKQDESPPVSPSMPSGVKLSSEVLNQIVVSWDLDSNVKTYTVEYSKDRNFLVGTIQKEVSGSSTVTLENLEPGATYYVRLAAKGSSTSDFSSPLSITIKTDTQAVQPAGPVATLPAPSKPAASDITSSSFIVNWGAVAGSQKYRIEFSRTSNFAKLYTQESTTTNTKLTGLAGNMTYYVRIAAVANDVSSSWSELGSGKTAVRAVTPTPTPSPTPTPAPTPTPIVVPVPKAVRLTKGPVSGGKTYIDARWTPATPGARTEIFWTGSTLVNKARAPRGNGGETPNSDRAANLSPNTRYCFKVREYSGSTPSAWTTEVCVVTSK